MKKLGFVHLGFCGTIAAAALVLAGQSSGARAADFGMSCCADLEDRIAELEAAAALKSTRKTSLTVSGQINKYLLSWDDGRERNGYVSDNRNDPSAFGFDGEGKVSADVTAGYEVLIRVPVDLAERVDQNNPRAQDGFEVRLSNVWLESTAFGKVTLGKAARVSDGGPEMDLSEAETVGYAGVHDPIGSFKLRRTDGVLTDVAWGDLIDDFNGDPANLVRYDTPSLAGLIASVSWGEDDVRDAGLSYTFEDKDVLAGAIIAYTHVTGEGGAPGRIDEDTVVGSASIRHKATGLNVTVAAGQRMFNAATVDSDGVSRQPEAAKFIYLKGGWLAKLNSLGSTAFYGEYAVFNDYVSAGTDAAALQSIATGPVGCARVGALCRVEGSQAEMWGFGVVQIIEAADMQIYIGYRMHSAYFDLIDGKCGSVAGEPLVDFQTVIYWAKISF